MSKWRNINRFDWVEALVSSPHFKNRPGAVRIGTILAVAFFNEEAGMAWPSRVQLAKRVNSAPERVSSWLAELREAGAITTQPQGQLAPGLRKSSDPRSLVYRLNFDWAAEILIGKRSSEGLKGEPVPPCRSVTMTVTDNVTMTVTDVGDGGRHTEPLRRTISEPQEETGLERGQPNTARSKARAA